MSTTIGSSGWVAASVTQLHRDGNPQRAPSDIRSRVGQDPHDVCALLDSIALLTGYLPEQVHRGNNDDRAEEQVQHRSSEESRGHHSKTGN